MPNDPKLFSYLPGGLRIRTGDDPARRMKGVEKLRRTKGEDAAEMRRKNPQAEYGHLKDFRQDKRRRPNLTPSRHYKENR